MMPGDDLGKAVQNLLVCRCSKGDTNAKNLKFVFQNWL